LFAFGGEVVVVFWWRCVWGWVGGVVGIWLHVEGGGRGGDTTHTHITSRFRRTTRTERVPSFSDKPLRTVLL